MSMFLSLRYSKMVNFFLSTTFSVTEVTPTRDSATWDVLRRQFESILENTFLFYCFRSYPITVAAFSVLVHQMFVLNTKKFVFAYLVLDKRPKIISK